MLMYQFAYYMLRKWDQRAGMPISFTKFKTVIFATALETWVLLLIYGFADRLIFSHVFFGSPVHEIPSSIIGAFAYALIVCYLNQQLLGSDGRIHRYKAIFDSWDKAKCMRWNIYVISLALGIFAAFFLVAEINQRLSATVIH